MSKPRGHVVWVCEDCGASHVSEVAVGERAFLPSEMIAFGPWDAQRLMCVPCYEKWDAADRLANPDRPKLRA